MKVNNFINTNEKPIIVNKRTISKSKLFKIEALNVKFSNGVERELECVKEHIYESVLIVPILNSDTILLISEFCAGTNQYENYFPRGRIEPGEDILDAANRELKEEIGFGSKQLLHVKTLKVSPGHTNHQTHIVLAEELYTEKLAGDEPEKIKIIPWPKIQLRKLINLDEFCESISIAALLLVEDIISNR